jgi:hypothetical protein
MYASGGMWGGMNGGMTGSMPTNTSGPCVSSIAIRAYQNVILNQNNPYGGYNPYGGMTNQIGMTGGTGQILSALVYLYLNSGTPIGPFAF